MSRNYFKLSRTAHRPYIKPAAQLSQALAAEQRRRPLRFLLAVAVVALWAYSAAAARAPEATCSTDSECMEACLAALAPNRPESECDL